MKRLLRKYRRQKRPKVQDNQVPQRASLEGLAVEIQQAILHQMPDLQTFQALISASTYYPKAYRSQENVILSSVVLRDIHPDVLFDVLAVIDAAKLPRNYDDYVPQLKVFVEQYKATRASLDGPLRPLEPSDEKSLRKLHLSVFDVTTDFCNYALSTHPITGHSQGNPTSLSQNEVRRIHRAFYRYEFFTVLFRVTKSYRKERRQRRREQGPRHARLALQRDSLRSLDAQDESWLFLALFQTWEVEEIACVRDYITYRYDERYQECRKESLGTTGGETGYGASSEEDYLEWLSTIDEDGRQSDNHLSLGLGLFHTFIMASQEDQSRIIREHAGISIKSLSTALAEEGLDFKNPIYDAWHNGTFQAFRSDSEKDGPNAAWLWSTRNNAELDYYQPDKRGLRKWGYVMWDRERLDQRGILQNNIDDYLIS